MVCHQNAERGTPLSEENVSPVVVAYWQEKLWELVYTVFANDVRNFIGRTYGPSGYRSRRLIARRKHERAAEAEQQRIERIRFRRQLIQAAGGVGAASIKMPPMWKRDP